MHKNLNASRNGKPTASEFVLVDSITAHALLNLADSAKDEERRFRAILKAEEVVLSMDAILADMPSRDERRQSIEKARFELVERLDRAMNAASLT